MRELTTEQLNAIDGAGFVDGLACGFTLAAAAYVTFSPDPLTKLAIYSAYTGATVACGRLL